MEGREIWGISLGPHAKRGKTCEGKVFFFVSFFGIRSLVDGEKRRINLVETGVSSFRWLVELH
jgi:hypothetical protein